MTLMSLLHGSHESLRIAKEKSQGGGVGGEEAILAYPNLRGNVEHAGQTAKFSPFLPGVQFLQETVTTPQIKHWSVEQDPALC